MWRLCVLFVLGEQSKMGGWMFRVKFNFWANGRCSDEVKESKGAPLDGWSEDVRLTRQELYATFSDKFEICQRNKSKTVA